MEICRCFFLRKGAARKKGLFFKGNVMKEKKTLYYREESDVLYESSVRTKTVDKNFDYERKGLWDLFLRHVFVRIFVMPFAKFWTRFGCRSRFVNRKALKKYKGGYFLYGNHTQDIPDAFRAAAAPLPRMSYIIVHPDNVSFPGLQHLMMALGTIPIPTKQDGMRNFMKIIEKRAQKHPVVVFPERTIWPYYTKIRSFDAVSFHYPVRFDKPVFTMTVTYQKRKFSDKPRETVYIDGPFYPNKELSLKERAQDLRDRVYAQMCERAKNSTYEYVRYVRLEKDMRDETLSFQEGEKREEVGKDCNLRRDEKEGETNVLK